MEELNEQETREEAKRMAQREAERVHHEVCMCFHDVHGLMKMWVPIQILLWRVKGLSRWLQQGIWVHFSGASLFCQFSLQMVKLAVPEPQSSMQIKERMKASKGGMSLSCCVLPSGFFPCHNLHSQCFWLVTTKRVKGYSFFCWSYNLVLTVLVVCIGFFFMSCAS